MTTTMSPEKWSYRDEEVLKSMYWREKMSLQEIADEFDVHQTTILKWMRRNDIERRSEGRQRSIQMKVRTDPRKGHEYVQHREPEGNVVKVKIHRLVAVAWFGFDEVSGNVVHHADPEGSDRPGVGWDNRESVLEVMSHSEHSRQHARTQPWMAGSEE